MSVPALIVAGAAQFCLGAQGHVACQPPPPLIPVVMTGARVELLTGLVEHMQNRDVPGEAVFRNAALASNDYRGDCAAETAWALAQLARRDPAMFRAARPVFWFNSIDGRSEAHMALIILTPTQAIIVDGVSNRLADDGALRAFSHEELRARASQLYIAPEGIAGRWTRYLS
jgi:hypothetical protein